MLIALTVDGARVEVEASPAASLLTVLRDRAGVTRAKNACESGECGSCLVWLDGTMVPACLVPAVQADGAAVRTVSSLAEDGELHRVQSAFVEAGAVQCGYCTPGMVVAAVDLLARNPAPDRTAIEEALAGNLCRCSGYQKIVEAVELAAGEPVR